MLRTARLYGSDRVLLMGPGQEARCAVLLGGLEATPTLLVLVLKYLWRYILGIYFHFSVLVYIFYFGHYVDFLLYKMRI